MYHCINVTRVSCQTELPEGLNMNRLLAILHEYGEYPAKYR